LVLFPRPDYPELIEYRLKQSMPVKITRCFVTGRSPHPSIFGKITLSKVYVSIGYQQTSE
ncbi:MAG: hypothetical protein Q7I89_01260, partial [Syntrophales bacterium]|nr:hypothetical protein [Syntrophales bacterium]